LTSLASNPLGAPGPATLPVSASQQHFRTDHLLPDLKGRSVRGGVITLGAQGVKFVLQLGSTAVLARLLTPADFGLIAMVATFTGFAALFKDLGLSQATVQREHVTHEQVSTLFWINVAVAALIGLLVAAMAPAVAWFYGEPRLAMVTVALGSTFVFGGLAAQHAALLRRQMRFGPLAAVEVASLAGGIAAAVWLALAGAGYWALVAMTMGQALVTAAGLWIVSGWSPGRPRRGAGIRPMLGFGGNVTAFNLFNYFSRNADNLLIGWYWGAASLGLYSKAYSLLTLPMRQVNGPAATVAVPALARLAGDSERYRRAFISVQATLLMVSAPAMAVLLVEPTAVVSVFLGDQWLAAAPILRWLALIGIIQVATQSNGWVFTTQGRTREMMWWGLVGGLLSVGAFLAGLPWGGVGVAASYALSGVLVRTPLMLWWLGRKGPVGAWEYLSAVRPTVPVTAGVIVLIVVLRELVGLNGLPLVLAMPVAVGIAYLVGYMLSQSTRTQVHEIRDMVLPQMRSRLRVGAL
jgi:O-antigen/teichoic acid export membrane protein